MILLGSNARFFCRLPRFFGVVGGSHPSGVYRVSSKSAKKSGCEDISTEGSVWLGGLRPLKFLFKSTMRRAVLGASLLRPSRWAERPAPRTPSGGRTSAPFFFLGGLHCQPPIPPWLVFFIVLLFRVRLPPFFSPCGCPCRLALFGCALCPVLIWLLVGAPLLP